MTVDGIRELRRAFDEEIRRARGRVESAVGDGAARIADVARSLAPAESGRLRGSIRPTAPGWRGGVVAAEVVCDGGHDGEPVPAATEFGTRDEPAHPFMRPAASRQAPSIARDIADAIGE